MDPITLDVSATPHLVSQVMFRCVDVQRVIKVQQVLEDRGGGGGTECEPTKRRLRAAVKQWTDGTRGVCQPPG
ncbi:hypothetical protein EYF80_037972 [Liparis tanakae]|uniref:Uncharacterized protein n=1 Tax=Liparis tanakae TaxID=230148 RepID=A0A4Z2GGD7_9TELE|nr:hypothetical protein EYF80_037972 [Liparis tanakae]